MIVIWVLKIQVFNNALLPLLIVLVTRYYLLIKFAIDKA